MRFPQRTGLLLCSAALSVVAPRAGAQPSPTETAGYLAILLTPVGGLPSVVRVRSAADATKRFDADVRYDSYKLDGNSRLFHNWGLSARMRLLPRLSLGGIVGTRTCSGCEGLRMYGGDALFTIVHKAASEPGSGDTDLGVLLSGGIGKPNKAAFNARSVALTLPLAITLPQPEHRVLTLHLAPSLAYGYITDDGGAVLGYVGGDGTTRAIVAAGVGYTFAPGVGLHVSVHRIIIENSPTQLGFALSWAFGGRGR